MPIPSLDYSGTEGWEGARFLCFGFGSSPEFVWVLFFSDVVEEESVGEVEGAVGAVSISFCFPPPERVVSDRSTSLPPA